MHEKIGIYEILSVL